MYGRKFWQTLALFAPETDPADGGGGGGSGADDAEERKFTQADLDRVAKGRAAAADRKYSKYVSPDDFAAKMAERDQELADLKAKLEDIGANENQRNLNQLARELKSAQAQLDSFTRERDAAFGERDAARAELDNYVVSQVTSTALVESGALPESMRHAVAMMQMDCKPTLATKENGQRVVQYEIGGVLIEDAAEAAKRWLATNRHFAKAKGGSGSAASVGIPTMNGGGSIPFNERSAGDLIAEGLTKR